MLGASQGRKLTRLCRLLSLDFMSSLSSISTSQFHSLQRKFPNRDVTRQPLNRTDSVKSTPFLGFSTHVFQSEGMCRWHPCNPYSDSQSAGIISRRLSGAAATSSYGGDGPLLTSFNGHSDVKPLESVRDKLDKKHIFLQSYAPGDYRLHCPKCLGGRGGEESFSVTISEDGKQAKWHCFRGTCGFSGVTTGFSDGFPAGGGGTVRGAKKNKAAMSTKSEASVDAERALARSKINRLRLEPLSKGLLEYFNSRNLSESTLLKYQVRSQPHISPNGLTAQILAFPYLRDGETVNVKFRTIDKRFWQIKGAEKILYGLDDIKGASEIIFVEGEMDKLAMAEAGFANCVSVPDGAPAKVSQSAEPPPPTEDKKYEYLWNCRAYLDPAKKIVLAVDADDAGHALAEELARRLGRERCYRVTWPNGLKDANEVLLEMGKEAVAAALQAAEPYPIRGLFRFGQFFEELDDFYYCRLGNQRAVSTGWKNLDPLYNIVPGELTIVTGVPNSGKSEWLDALLVNLNVQQGWTFALCSLENKVRDHGRKLLEKRLGKPFFDSKYSDGVPRMSREDYEEGKAWLQESFVLMRCEDEEMPSIDWVLNLAKAAVMRHGIRGLVIDPYNELDHQRPPQQTETEYVSKMLSKVKRFAQNTDCHVWFVAHPKQLQSWKGDPPNLYDISGSAHFINKCDNGIVVHRHRDDPMREYEVDVLVRKVRNKIAGTLGEATLKYERSTGRYMDVINL